MFKVNEATSAPCRLDYEAEYNKLREENACLKHELEGLKTYCEMREDELSRLRAQLDIVYLIFGGDR
ncbi:MAG: hypothetical protein IJV74_06910 [Clostridia bacterium]|nr:hypothetical protein [Clostridia bacterium]